ncbi:hypothetical protein EDB89DRAFT_1116560 [Lactarius sanguifluus]|nr:hypothetical protein EDB89DRAFT_1116560 [Lactarius sanguifluus]
MFKICRMDELGHAPWRHRPWKWQRLAHVCRTWRHIILASPLHLHLGLLCTNGTPVKKDLGHLPALPIVISYLRPYFQDDDGDNLIAALEHRDRVRVVGLTVPRSLLYELATAMQGPFPALTHLRLESEKYVIVPPLPDTFLGGSAPRLRTFHISGISFPAVPPLLSSAHDLIYVHLRNIPLAGYIPPEKMVASLAALPRLKYLTVGFKSGMPYLNRIRLPPTTRKVLLALSRFTFYGPVFRRSRGTDRHSSAQLLKNRIPGSVWSRRFSNPATLQVHRSFAKTPLQARGACSRA